MTKSVGVHDAKTNLSRLLDDVEHGGEYVIERRGKPVAMLSPYWARTPAFGTGGPIVVHDDFDELPPDIAEALGS